MKLPVGEVNSVFSDSEADEEDDDTNCRLMGLKISPEVRKSGKGAMKEDSKRMRGKAKLNGHPPVVHPFEESHKEGQDNSCYSLVFGRPAPAPTPSPSQRMSPVDSLCTNSNLNHSAQEAMHGRTGLWPDYPLVAHSGGFGPQSYAPSCCCSEVNGSSLQRPTSPPLLSHSLMGIPQSYNIYSGTSPDGLYRSSSMASVFGGCNGRKPILSPPKLASVNSHHYQMLNFSSIHCRPYNMMGLGYGYSAAASMYQGVGLRNMYNPSPSNSQTSSGFVSGGTTTSSVEGWNLSDPAKCPPRNGRSQLSTGHRHCCCSRRSVTPCQSLNSDNLSRERSSNEEVFSDDEEMDCKTKSSSVQSSQLGKQNQTARVCSRMIKKGTIKTDSASMESSSRLNSILNAFSRIIIFLTVLSVFCIFFVGKWPEPIDRYIDTVHHTFRCMWDSTVPYIMSYIHITDISSTVFPYY